MTPFQVEFIRFGGEGEEIVVLRRDLRSDTVFDAEREALRVRGEDEAPLAAQFDAAFLCREGPRLRRYGRTAEGIARWGRA